MVNKPKKKRTKKEKWRKTTYLRIKREEYAWSLQYLTVLLTGIIRRCKIDGPSVKLLPTTSPTEYVRQNNVRR
jgi:hypothetical protein